MPRESVFTVYLPSNSPGAEPLQQSEDQSNMISSYYKTTLDSTIDLVGEWSVGLAEICFPSKLLSEIDEFKIGVVIMNPADSWQLEVRRKYLADRKGQSLQAAEVGNPNSWPIDGLDMKVIPYGVEKTEGIITVNEENLNLPFFKPFTDSHLRTGIVSDDGKPQARAKASTPVSRAEVMEMSAGNSSAHNVVEATGIVNMTDIMKDWIVKGPIHPKIVPAPTVPAPTIDWVTRTVPEYERNRRWSRTAYNEIAVGKKLLLEIPATFSGLDVIPKSFYQSRNELVSILNERMNLIVQNRSYPHKKYSDVLTAPFLHGRDSGVVSVLCGFVDRFNSTYTPYTHLSPVIYSEKVIKFLGFDRKRWKYDPIIRGFIYSVTPGDHYARRDSAAPILLPIATQGIKVYEEHASDDRYKESNIFNDIFLNDQFDMLYESMLQFIWEKIERGSIITHWAEKRLSLLHPKLSKPQFLYLYCDIASPSHIGNMKAAVLRITSLKTRDEASSAAATTRYYQNEPEKFVHILRAPVSRKSFNSITVFLSDEFGSQLIFDEGTVYVVLEFKRTWDNSFI